MAETNPFQYLLQTPDVLRAQRQQRFDAENPVDGSDFWVRQMGAAGLQMRQNLVEQGKWLNADDRKALVTQGVMANAQKNIADMVKSGKMDPMDAQELAVKQAMSEFMALGDFRSAQSLLPGLNSIRQYREELSKLKSETAENQAQTVESESKTIENLTQADRIGKLLPSEISENKGQTAQAEAAARMNDAHARLYDRTDPNIRAAGAGGGSARKILPSRQAELTEGFAATMGVFDSLNELSLFMEQVPEAASAPGKVVNTAAQYVSGMHNFLAQRGTTEKDVFKNLTEDQQALARKGMAQRAKNAASLGMNVTAYNSAVIDTAYAMARAMDPGGRLSNNDFAYALEALGAVQDARSAKAAFAAIARRAYTRYKNTVKGEGTKEISELFPEQMGSIEGDYAEFEKRWGGAHIIEADKAKQAAKRADCTPLQLKYNTCPK